MKKRMRMAAAVMAAVMGMMTLGGCGTASEKSETAAQAEGSDAKQTSEDGKSQDLKEINVVLDWYPNAIHTFIYTAIERGYYAEEGLDVKVRFPANANDALSLVAAGKAEIGMYYQQDVIQAVANQGTKIKSIGAIVQSPLSVVLSLKDKNITGPENLVGKSVGYGGERRGRTRAAGSAGNAARFPRPRATSPRSQCHQTAAPRRGWST